MSYPRRFSDLLHDYGTARHSGHEDIAQAAADRLPLTSDRERAYLYELGGSVLVSRSWAASVSDAARDLHNLITIHDNGGTASSPKKIKKAARELLRLLGED